MGDFGGDERGNRIPHNAPSHDDYPDTIGDCLLHTVLSYIEVPDPNLYYQDLIGSDV